MSLVRPEDVCETATGRKVGYRVVDGTCLYKLQYTDGKSGRIPDHYAGMYTSIKEADFAVKRLVDETWEVAEASTRIKKSA